MKSPHLLALLGGAALAVVPLPGLTAPAQAGSTHKVMLAQMAFGPVPKSIHVGDTVEWVNDDIFVHSATATDKNFDVELKPKAHMWTTFHKPGTFPFSCRYHPGMKGVLVVVK